ncbi:Kynurenine 3-monooxygenase [Durusdinium trenchii]|uniref:Kynurenine 3-monooxygenase n=1 Tax=Durusdinium trenchii TaxID=1381693 RepID=A0ABP0N6H7_9DINO
MLPCSAMLFLWLCLTKIQLAITRPSPYTWVPQKREAEFGPIYAHTALMNFRQEIFLIAGARHEGNLSDEVWRSDDKGKTWQFLVPRSKRFNARRGHASVVDHEGVIFFVMGGFHGNSEVGNDCWSSEDGAVWHFLGHAPWSGRHGHAAAAWWAHRWSSLRRVGSWCWEVMTTGSISMMFGRSTTSRSRTLGRATCEPNGWRWRLAARPGPRATVTRPWWTPRTGSSCWEASSRRRRRGEFTASTTFGVRRILVRPGTWWAMRHGLEGTNMLQLGTAAPPATRFATVSNGTPYWISKEGPSLAAGGLSVDLERLGDVWRSEDQGRSWREVTPVAAWPARYEHAAVVDRNGTMYVLGGISKTSELFADVWHSARTCSDHVDCSGDTPVCRDGTSEHFEGATRPVCVGICDRRIFDDCGAKEDCKVQHGKPTCVDPCDDKDCEKEQVCEVAPRDQVFRKKMLHSATAYCLSCSVAQTKASCGELRQCQWSTKDEACLMRCSVMDRARCKGNDHCSWKEDKCSDKK